MKNTKSDRKTSRQACFRARLLAVAVSSCFAAVAQGAGINPAVVAGSATFNQNGSTMTVTNSNGTIINWDALSVMAGEKLVFNQAATSSVLNRVIGMNVNGKWVIDPTVIAGTISSPGSVWIINPAGIMAKQGAVIDVGRLVASTLDVSNANFLAGKLLFNATPGAGAVTVDSGATIKTSTGGSVYLIGSGVSNNGIISTPQGEAILAAGETVSIVDSGTPGVKVEITGAAGNVTNLGTVLAEAGRIGMAGALVRNSGTLNASSVVKEGGRIFLKASQDAYVDGDGRIVTTGTKGGSVEVLGNRVAVMDNASIDASGTNGGGTVLVGGDYQGKNVNIQNSTVTYFGKNASIKADAAGTGNGGKVILWADDTTRAYGKISARGGVYGGNGGFVETSGHNYLATDGAQVDTRAPNGKTGTWLLDPANITIAHSGTTGGSWALDGDYYFNAGSGTSTLLDSDISSRLLSNNVIVDTSRGSGGTGHITVNGGVGISAGGGTTLSLLADGNIAFNGSSSGITLDGFSLVLNAGNSISGSSISMNGVTMSNMSGFGASINSGGGNISITNSTLPVAGTVNIASNGGSLTLTNSQLSVTDSAYGMTVDLGSTGNLTLQAANSGAYGSASLSAQGSQTITANNVTLNAGSSGTNNTAEIVSYGGQTITAAGTIALYGGATGQGNSAVIGNYNTDASQIINAHTLWMQGGGSQASDFNDSALVESSVGTQQINITGAGGSITLRGGAGGSAASAYGGLAGASVDSDCASAAGANYCYSSRNSAEIVHRDFTGAYGQTISFDSSGGSIAMYGGSGGAGNSARISNRSSDNANSPGAQTIGDGTYAPDIYMQGGSSGGKVVYGSDGKWYDFRNSANIDSDSSYATVYGASLTMIGGSGVSGALIGSSPVGGGGHLTVDVTGDLIMTGGSSSAVTAFNDSNLTTNFASPVGIGSDKSDTVSIFANNITMTSGANAGGQALIGSLYESTTTSIMTGGAVTLTSNGALVAIGSMSDDSTMRANSTVTVNAGGAVSTSGGSAVSAKLVSGSVRVFSTGTSVGGLAIDVDTDATDISAGVGCTAARTCTPSAVYGSISLRNYSSSAPTSVYLQNYANTGGNISFYNQSALTTASSIVAKSNSGDVLVTAGGDVDLGAFRPYASVINQEALVPGYEANAFTIVSLNGDVTGSSGSFAAKNASGSDAALSLVGKNIRLSGQTVTGSSVNLVGTNSVALSNSAVTATTGNLTVVSPTITVAASQLLAYGNLTMVGNNIWSSQGSRFSAGYDGSSVTNADANVTMTVTGNVVLNDGVTVESGNDTIINLQGVFSKLYLNESSGMSATKIVSDIATQVPATTHLNFLYGTGGGVVIDGVTTTSTASGGSGFYVLNGSTVASPGFGLDVVYLSASNPVTEEVTKVTTTVLNKITNDDNLTDATSSNNLIVFKPIDDKSSIKPSVGGNEDEFGGNDKKTDGASSDGSNKKDENHGKSTSKNQCS